MSRYKSRRAWWTKERVILGLQRFYEKFGFCPLNDGDYRKHQQFTGKIIGGRHSTRGHDAVYPSTYAIWKHFPTMRDAWSAAGFDVDRAHLEWLPIEDWFIIESCGILPRTEVAEILKRSVSAVKRRLYDLGDITSKTRWGVTVHRAETLMNISGSVLRRYIKHGVLPVFRGNRYQFLNPADLPLIEEFDWTSPVINPELELLVRRALIQRFCKILKFGSRWREHEIYRFEAKKVYHGRIKNPRKSPLLKHTPDPPNDLQTGDWIKVTVRHRQIAPERVGRIFSTHYSWQKVRRKDGTRRACWMARIEFPKLRKIKGEHSRRIHYSLPLDCLVKAEEPERETPPLLATPEAERGRKRQAKYQSRARDRFGEIRKELS